MRLARRNAVQVDDESEPILSVEGLTIGLPKGADRPFAVEDASLELRRGEILCVVGESGSGKSALSGAIMGAPAPGLRVVAGSVRLKGQELTKLSERAWCRIRGNRIAMIFQEPMASLNPAVPVGLQIMEVFELHAKLTLAGAARAGAGAHPVDAVTRPRADRGLLSAPTLRGPVPTRHHCDGTRDEPRGSHRR